MSISKVTDDSVRLITVDGNSVKLVSCKKARVGKNPFRQIHIVTPKKQSTFQRVITIKSHPEGNGKYTVVGVPHSWAAKNKKGNISYNTIIDVVPN